MTPTHFLNIHLAKVYDKKVRKGAKYMLTLGWGDTVELVEQTAKYLKIKLKDFKEATDGSMIPAPRTGYIVPSSSSSVIMDNILAPIEDSDVLKLDFVDVQQGDGAVIETPKGEIMLIDGGDNQLFARYLAGRFRGTNKTVPRDIAAILVTHGDADHFSGLVKIYQSETTKQMASYKRLFINPMHIFHNGIVKRPGKLNGTDLPETKLLGATSKDAKENLYVSKLWDNLLEVPDDLMNKPFLAWKKALLHYYERNENMILQRIDDKNGKAMNIFADEGIDINVLGPITKKVSGKPALKFLKTPPKLINTPQLKKTGDEITTGSYSASHTINGHSVVFKLQYGKFNALFAGDLNEEAEDILTAESKKDGVLRSHVLKVPHHGSADFSSEFLAAVNPLVSIVSSGDETERKEYIHPRATLMGALGKHSRTDRPLVFVTELVAFFKQEGWSVRKTDIAKEEPLEFFGFSRTAFGIVKMRTDGQVLLVYTNSGQKDMKEAYAYDLKNPAKPQRIDPLVV